MEEFVQRGVDKEQVKKAVRALLAYHKTRKNANSLLLNEHEQLSLMLTVWKIPNKAQVIRIPLPHAIRPVTCDVCLFTRDEPNMSTDQTEMFYKKLLSKHGVKHISEIIPLRKMKKEYKQFEAKRRLLGRFDLFLADSRIRRLLPSHIGKHFYKEKREPSSVNLKHKNLAAELNRHIQGTRLHINTRGCCCSVRVGHIGMKVEELVENILAVTRLIADKLPQKWKNVKSLHLKTHSSVALPIYTSSLNHLKELDAIMTKKKPTTLDSEETGDQIAMEEKDTKKFPQESTPATPGSEQNGHPIVKKSTKRSAKGRKLVTSGLEETGAAEKKAKATPHKGQSKPDNDEEEIPDLIPIQETTSTKKIKKRKTDVQEEKTPKLEKSVHVLSAKKAALRKRKMNESEEVMETPSKNKKDLASKGNSKKPEKQETPPKSRMSKKTPKKTPSTSAVKLTKSARKAPQTPKLKQKKMKAPQSV